MAENSWIEATPVTATSSTEGWVEASAIPEKEPETSWMGAIKPVPALVASGMVKAGAGIADIIGASDTAKGWRESANVVDKQIQAELPVDETSWKGATRNALTSMGTQALPIAAGVLTGGAAVPLMGMGAIAGAQKMSDLTEAGVGYGKALPASILSGGVEVVTEKIPFTSFLRLLKGKSGVASAITKMMISEQLGEQAANMSDQVIDQLKPDETWSWDKFKSSVIATAKATLVQSGMMGAGGAAVGKVASRRDRTTTALPTPESQIEQTVLPPVPATNEGRRQKRLNRNIATDLVKKQEEQKLFIEALDAEKQDTAEGNLIIAEEPVVLKDAGQREFVEAKVAELGSVAEVDKLYKGKSDVEVYAREKARELFPVQEEAIDYKAEAEKYGVDYNGMQEVPSGMQPFPLFTMKEGIETTFTLEAGETLPQAIARKQKQAAEAGTDQTSVQNMNKGATTIEELSPERIANMERLHDIAQKYALERAQYKLDVETLKREEWSDADIKKMGPEEVARKASVIRGDLDVSGTSELNINKMSEIEKQTMDIAERRARGEEIPEAELDELIAKMSDTEGVPITDIFTRSTYFDQIDPDTGLSPSLAEFEKRVAAVRAGFDRALRRRKPVVSEVDQKVATRRREKIKTEIAETLEETKPDVDYEKLLADEGMPAELEFASQGGTQKSAKQQSLSAKVKFDKTMSLTRAFTSDREARNTMVQGYKFRPETLVEAKKHLQSLIRAEQMAEPHIKSKRVAFDSKVIAKALREKVITKEQAKYIETILSTLKQQPDFTLKLDPTLDMQFGIYALADNLMTLKSEKATAHEVMHWAFYNVLTGQERVAYYREYMNQFYNKAGNFRAIKARTVTSDFYNASKSPAEMFAARGSDIANGYKLTATERSLFQKTIDWFKGLSAKLSKKLGVDLGKIDRLYDKVMDDSARKVWDDAEDVRVSAGEIDLAYANENAVFHGTKAQFDSFKDDYIGSGEGAQMRGWGHYFTSKEDLGRYYARQIGSSKKTLKDLTGVQLDKAFIDVANMYYKTGLITESELSSYLNKTNRRSSKLALVDGFVNSRYVDSKTIKETLGDLVNIESSKILHKVELPDDLNLLDLDGSILDTQAKSISEALKQFITEREVPGTTGGYEISEAKRLSKALDDIAIPINNSSFIGKTLSEDLINPFTGSVYYKEGHVIDQASIDRIIKLGIERIMTTEGYLTLNTPKYNFTGESIQTAIQSIFGKRGASEFLRDKAGIQGNTYVGETSGVQNYVIFDENIPKITSSEILEQMRRTSIINQIREKVKQYKLSRENRGAGILAEVKGTDDISRGVFIASDKPKPRPVGPYFRSPMEFVKDTINEKHVYNLNRAEQFIASKFDQHRAEIRVAQEGLSKEEKKNIRLVLEKKIDGSIKEQEAAGKVRVWLDSMKAAYKTFLLNDYKKNLNNREYAALLDVISGSTPEQIALRYPKLDIDTIAEIAKNYTDIATWGLDDYVPNVEKGRFKIVENKIDEKGKAYQKLVGIGLSERDATRKAVAHLTANPDSGSLSIDTDFKVINDDKTSVSSKQYFAMQNKLAKEIAASVDTIDKAVAKEMAAKTMGKKFTIKPTHAFSEYVQPRRDILKGEEDIFPVLESYAYSLEKKMALDPVIDLVKKDLNKMSAEERKYILDLTDDVKGRYHWEDQIIDQLFGTYRGYSKVVGGARTLEANIKLGWRPIAASINFASGQMHTWVKVGVRYYIDGVKLLRSPEGQKMMNEVRPFLGTTLALGEEMRAKTPIWKPLGMFQAVEPLNREVSVAANYLYAKNDLKMSETAAKEFAIRANWAQQFTYNIANLPKTMRGPTGRLITQFKPYLFKELEFMSNLSGKEWIRYTVMQLALGGPRGALMIMKSLPILAGLGFWEEAMENIEEWMNKEAPVVSRGIGGLPGLIKPEYGIDVSAAATFQFPAEPLDFVGPFLSDLTNLWKQVVVPMSTFGPTVQDAKRLLQPVVVMKYWTRALEYAVSKDNWVLDSHGNKLYEVPSALPFILQSVAGVENIDINRIKAQERILAKRDERTRGLVTRLTNQAMQLILDGKPIPQDLMDRMVKNGVTGDTLVNRVTRSQLPPDIRHILDAAIWQRPEVIRMEPNQSDYTFP